MKQKVKLFLNKITVRLFGYTVFPPQRTSKIEFKKIDVPERQVTCCEFNRISLNIYKLSNNY